MVRSRVLGAAVAAAALAMLAAALLAAPRPALAGGDAEAIAPQATTSSSASHTYAITQRGEVRADFGEFAALVRETLADGRGWARSGVTLTERSDGADFEVILASPSVVDSAHSVCSPTYSCRVGNQVLINDVRWREGTSSWTGSLRDYRRHVINHEVGHWLGLGHSDCPGAGEPAPVMQQQSIDLQGCEANWWPLDWEVRAVADLHGTTPGDPDDPEEPEESAALPGIVRDGKDWHLREALRGGSADHEFSYGRAGDVPLMGDWNGDGRRTPGVRRGKTWHLRDSLSGGPADHVFNYGRASDVPVVGDWNGDGAETPGVRRGKTWHLRDSLSGGSADHEVNYGLASDIPVVGDWNGDGTATPGVRRGKTWYLRDSLSGGSADHEVNYGLADDVPLVGDWNGDGADTIGIRRGGNWHLRDALRGGEADHEFSYGLARDLPVVWR